MNFSQTKLVSFDAFDTSVTMEENYWMAYVMQEFKLEREPTDPEIKRIRRLLVCENRPIVETLLYQGLINDNQVAEIQQRIDEEAESIMPVRGINALLKKLSAKYKLALVSNLGYDYGKPLLETLAFPFDHTVFSYEMGYRKPEPEIFRRLVDMSGLKPHEILHIGDKYQNDYRGAIDCGLNAIHLDLKNESKAGHSVSSIDELAKILK